MMQFVQLTDMDRRRYAPKGIIVLSLNDNGKSPRRCALVHSRGYQYMAIED
ncbi:MAG: hypothetical protein PWP51_2761 [Clostridiales bacterium]|jgi:hypothetical protein|nr:hypothetical protein [Clostridiales bacterium]